MFAILKKMLIFPALFFCTTACKLGSSFSPQSLTTASADQASEIPSRGQTPSTNEDIQALQQANARLMEKMEALTTRIGQLEQSAKKLELINTELQAMRELTAKQVEKFVSLRSTVVELDASIKNQGPITVDLANPGSAILFKLRGQLVSGLNIFATREGRPQLQIMAADQRPAITIGGDRAPADVQFSPIPVDRPRFHIDMGAGDGTYGDVRVDGTLTVGREAALCENPADRTTCVPVDPRGAIVIARGRPTNENMANLRVFRRNAVNGKVEEVWRQGTTADGLPFLNSQAGNDYPSYIFRPWTGAPKIFP